MSVPEGKRGESKLEVLVKAQQLTTYTIRICCNEKVFLPQYQSAVTDKLISLSEEIFIKSWTANNIIVNSTESYHDRLSLQKSAHDDCNSLLAMIQISKPVFHLDTKRIKYWGGMVLDIRSMLSKWREKDMKRYADYK